MAENGSLGSLLVEQVCTRHGFPSFSLWECLENVCVCVCVCVYLSLRDQRVKFLGEWAAAAAKSHQSCLILCDPVDGSPPGSPIPGILQARTLEWVAIAFSNAWKWKVKVKLLSRVRPSATPCTAAYQASPSMGFSRQEYWSGVPLPSPIALTRRTLVGKVMSLCE